MAGTRGVQWQAPSHSWQEGRFFGMQAECHPHILHPTPSEEGMLSRESAEIGLCESFHSTPPSPPPTPFPLHSLLAGAHM